MKPIRNRETLKALIRKLSRSLAIFLDIAYIRNIFKLNYR